MNGASYSVKQPLAAWRLLGVVLLLGGLMWPVLAQQPAPETKWKLVKVNFIGLQTRPPEEMTAASGLRIGQLIDVAGIRAASQKLSDTELFKKVSVRYQYTGDTIEVTFTVEEAKAGKALCIFDNFIWVTDEELHAAIKRDLPDFDGKVEQNDFTLDRLKQSLTQLLKERKVVGEVVAERNISIDSGETYYTFKVNAPNLKVCTVQFAGLKANLKKELAEAVQPHLNVEYARSESNAFMRVALLPIFQQNGYLKAKFAGIQARPAASVDCKSAGVLLTLPIEEGLQYRWDKALWVGNQAFSTKELDSLLIIKSGAVASSDKIAESFAMVRGIFGTKGYITAQLKPQPVFDDAQQRVTYQVAVSEGPQYRMGQLILNGVPENEVQRLRGRWKLKPGEILNTARLAEFVTELRKEQSNRDVETKFNLDKEKLTVDIEIRIQK